MRHIFLMVTLLALAGCAGSAPGLAGTVVPSATPVVVIQTVLVTPREQPTGSPAPTSTVAPTEPPAVASATDAALGSLATAEGGQLIVIPPPFYGQSFSKIAVSTSSFSLRCAPKQITFDVVTADIYVTQVDLYIRVRDKHSLDVPNWSWSRTLETDGVSHFWVSLTGEDVPPDLRKAQGWFDFQLVGIGKGGGVIGRTEKITDQVSYSIDC